MSETVIKCENLGKKYKIGNQEKYLSLRDSLVNAVKSPYNALIKKKSTKKKEIWALKNTSFEIKKGEVIGVIGKNGAGKSTLLKLLSRITEPTEGIITFKGKIASLLEVGTGFSDELTGRENIYLNGSILGMNKKEIDQKFADIVKFSGVKKFIDTPVKRYSSGMYVRLAFSVAAHIEPEILLVDEVLAVGDVEFQKKCLGKMREVTKKDGRTIIFVSHNMEAIKKICGKCMLLEDGQIKKFGKTNDIVREYLGKGRNSIKASLIDRKDREGEGGVKFTSIKVTNHQESEKIKSGDRLKIILKYESEFTENIKDVRVVIAIVNDDFQPVLWLDSNISADTFTSLTARGSIACETKEVNLVKGRYFVHINFHIKGESRDLVKMASEFDVITDNNRYNYKIKPDNNVCDYIVQYNFKQ